MIAFVAFRAIYTKVVRNIKRFSNSPGMRLVIRAIVYKCVVAMSRMCHPSYLVKYSLSSSTPLPLDFHLVVVIVVIVKRKVYCPLTQ